MAAYDKYFAGELEDVALDEAEIERALAAIEGLPTPACDAAFDPSELVTIVKVCGL